ncbi:hypothetical protein DEO72_LG1g2123 [Vigna unguiculata]|uniref:Uncharacterized protein n=1 Tax=Vigna unguiculata TaxID=3917 RepID=A0A4D6KP86_VIGUN|nr:hypothetical protein DEO72_LG1g2123 [Vigna unguiculata]
MAAATLAGNKFSDHREPPTPPSARTCTTMEAQLRHLLHCNSNVPVNFEPPSAPQFHV